MARKATKPIAAPPIEPTVENMRAALQAMDGTESEYDILWAIRMYHRLLGIHNTWRFYMHELWRATSAAERLKIIKSALK